MISYIIGDVYKVTLPNPTTPPPIPKPLYKVHLVDEDGDEYRCEVGGKDFSELRFSQQHFAELALAEAFKEAECDSCLPPVKATVYKEVSSFDVSQKLETKMTYNLRRN